VDSVTIDVDGQQVDQSKPGCSTQNCPLSRDWTFDATKYDPGHHTVTVTATDAVGRTTTKQLGVDIARDTAKPALKVSGPLKDAPEGWVDQRSYAVSADSSDSGSGVTSLKLVIDGQTVGHPVTQACPDGGCTLSHTFTVNTANYDGGAHDVKLVGTDGAGNDNAKSWTMNVNPDGNVSSGEAAATQAAADDTADSNTVAPTSDSIDPTEIADGNNPGLDSNGATLESTGTPATSTMTQDPGDGFTINAPDGAIHVTPTGVAGDAEGAAVTNDVAAVSADTSNEVDTVVRPIFDGVMTFESIRDATAPQTFSWQVTLDSDQTLESVDDQTAEVYFTDGTPAMMIRAEPAHDATGAKVPSTLSVRAPNVITLTVSHAGGNFVYPGDRGSWMGDGLHHFQRFLGSRPGCARQCAGVRSTGNGKSAWVRTPRHPDDRAVPLGGRDLLRRTPQPLSGCLSRRRGRQPLVGRSRQGKVQVQRLARPRRRRCVGARLHAERSSEPDGLQRAQPVSPHPADRCSLQSGNPLLEGRESGMQRQQDLRAVPHEELAVSGAHRGHRRHRLGLRD
jgi:hypothetical protein